MCPNLSTDRRTPELTILGCVTLLNSMLVSDSSTMPGRKSKVYDAIVERLMTCLNELDSLGNGVTSAHVDAAIHAILADVAGMADETEMEENSGD